MLAKEMKCEIRQVARAADIEHVYSILNEAANWLISINQQLWQQDELVLSTIEEEVVEGLYYLACWNEKPVGTFKFQLEDTLFWPDVPAHESAFIHRLAVKRNAAGLGVSIQMLNWAKAKAKELERKYLRLDCAKRQKLCDFYERNGFTKHSERQVGPYDVVRYEFSTQAI